MVLFLALASRLVMLQMTDARDIARTGLESRLAEEVLFAPRGSIYDQGHYVLAQSIEARFVFADPSRVNPKNDPDRLTATATALRDLLGVPISELMPKLTKKVRENGKVDEFEYLRRGVSIADADKVAALNLPGIGVGRDEIRVQPGNDLAANLIGYINDDGQGLYGIEAGKDDLLRGVDGKRTYEVGNGALGAQIPGGYEEVKAAHPGSSVQLTIDRDVQYMAQQALYQQMPKVNAQFACALVIDVRTGDIRAQASYPAYNAANPAGATALQKADHCTQTVVDPGSIHKIITLGAGLQTGVVNADSTVSICPTVTKGGTTFRDTHPFHCGTNITLPGILAFSSNVGTIALGAKMGPAEAQTIYDYQRLFGLGRSTDGGMPGEAAGLLQKPDAWSGSAYGSVPIGLGVSATPLQMAAAYTTLANNGTYVTPRLLKSVISPDGTVTACPPSATHPVLSPANAALLRQDLESVVTVPGATGHAAAITGYRIAGKTGTGQFVGPDGTYLPGTVASFVGMAPADAPRYVVAVFAYTPGGDEGGRAAAPAFHDLMSFTLGHYHVPPTGTNAPTFVTTR
jgi:cell division protein FtsI (penicillin-binding protein 3)